MGIITDATISKRPDPIDPALLELRSRYVVVSFHPYTFFDPLTAYMRFEHEPMCS